MSSMREQRNAFAGLQIGDAFAITVPIAMSLFVASIAYAVAEVSVLRRARTHSPSRVCGVCQPLLPVLPMVG